MNIESLTDHIPGGHDPARVSATGVDLQALDVMIDGLTHARRAVAAYQALEATLMAATVDLARGSSQSGTAELPMREVTAEVAAALRVSDRTVQAQFSSALTLVEDFPSAHRALQSGEISRSHANVITSEGARITDAAVRKQYEDLVLERARVETSGRLRGIAKAIAEKLNPQSLTERHRQALDGRRVWVTDLDDGMAELSAIGSAVLVHGVFDRLCQFARTTLDAERTASDENSAESSAENNAAPIRTMDEARTDAFFDLLLTGDACVHGQDALEGIRAHVQVTVPAMTLAGAWDAAGDLAGYGPANPDTLRDIAGRTGTWDRVLTDPVSGGVVAVETYRPTAEMRRFLRVRDEHCRFPGCRMAPWRSDIDHTIDAARGGATVHTNLAHLCRRHHVLKHQTTWSVTQLDSGKLKWVSPTGRAYIDTPAPMLRFIPDPDPAPDPPPF
ncbi:hypothetical protein FHX49_001492 [Microbacterium endophyticum]|uniref:DUF222 domain-containing protein n=1 Tax=Microbacterium endophyticum TaxID=1526412 RepID=A0A7W4YLY7_9MICO|nr:HNH endonuclease signature motif containing protein [Microbacterium endophyticum]MBB2975925.1 hypothetical protein [Microbacterium endophyticum]NIK37706.1 hypothetical protein [Microbacterium endophyticum]